MKTITSFILTIVSVSISFNAQEARHHNLCTTEKVKDQRDKTSNIKGNTIGQKLEGLLFWSQQEKERRFPLMQSIFPSLPVSSGRSIQSLKQGKKIQPVWEDATTLDTYMKDNHIKGIIVLKDGKIRLEKYDKGVNQHTLWTSFSVAKSVSSMLVGIALKNGDIKSLDDVLEQYIPELKGYDYGKISIRQLLTMTSGINWNEDYQDSQSDVAQMYLNPCQGQEAHILSYMKPLPSKTPPGTEWNYNTGETDLLGILLQKATGKSLASYLSENIWIPFGMQQCAFWLTDECSGLNIGGSGLSASLRDYAGLGALMLQNGQKNGVSVFSEEWLEQATTPLHSLDKQGSGYGYLWWCNPDGSYAAYGLFGQMIYVNPQEQLVIAQVAAWPKSGGKDLSKNRADFIKAIRKAL